MDAGKLKQRAYLGRVSSRVVQVIYHPRSRLAYVIRNVLHRLPDACRDFIQTLARDAGDAVNGAG